MVSVFMKRCIQFNSPVTPVHSLASSPLCRYLQSVAKPRRVRTNFLFLAATPIPVFFRADVPPPSHHARGNTTRTFITMNNKSYFDSQVSSPIISPVQAPIEEPPAPPCASRGRTYLWCLSHPGDPSIIRTYGRRWFLEPVFRRTTTSSSVRSSSGIVLLHAGV